jgi:hypothetical protein
MSSAVSVSVQRRQSSWINHQTGAKEQDLLVPLNLGLAPFKGRI